MKVYTKKGDDGTTGLLGGTRLPKHHLRITSYGNVDELNAFLGALLDHDVDATQKQLLMKVQSDLFTIGSHLAADPEKNKMELPAIEANSIVELEEAMDQMESSLPEMKYFVMPGGHPAVSAAHVCRCVCRRAERSCVELSYQDRVEGRILQYLNRLSDYFFVLSRKIAADCGAEERPWKPNERK